MFWLIANFDTIWVTQEKFLAYIIYCAETGIEYMPEPEWVSAIVAVAALVLTVFEYYFRRRPYLKLNIEVIEKDGGYVFRAYVINFGVVPACFSFKKEDVVIKIGDEMYESAKDAKAYAFPTDDQPPSFDLGTINRVGIGRLLNNEYNDNTAYLEVMLTYSSYRLEWVSYRFKFRYDIILTDGSNGEPQVKVVVSDQSFT